MFRCNGCRGRFGRPFMHRVSAIPIYGLLQAFRERSPGLPSKETLRQLGRRTKVAPFGGLASMGAFDEIRIGASFLDHQFGQLAHRRGDATCYIDHVAPDRRVLVISINAATTSSTKSRSRRSSGCRTVECFAGKTPRDEPGHQILGRLARTVDKRQPRRGDGKRKPRL